MRMGFTIVETMIALAIGAVVLVSVGSPFLAVHRMLHATMAEAEMSLAMREMRDKILFKASPDISGRHYAGLLSCTSLNEGEARGFNSVEMGGHTVGSALSDTNAASARLLVWTIDGRKMLINERTPNKDAHARWLWPGVMSLVKRNGTLDNEDDVSMSDVLGYGARNSNGSNIYRLYLDIDQKMHCNADWRIVRRERVGIPVLGKLQPMRDAE